MLPDFTITSKESLIEAVECFGFLPFFRNAVPGFSIAEHIAPELWFTDVEGPWEWKGPVIRETKCAYGKFFEHKAVFISREWFPDFANFRREGFDFEERYFEGLCAYADKTLYDILRRNAPILSKDLKRLGNYRKGGNTGFDTAMNRLQAQCYAITGDFVYAKDRFGLPYGWGVAVYTTPEQFYGEDFSDEVYNKTPEESFRRVYEHLQKLTGADDKRLMKLLR